MLRRKHSYHSRGFESMDRTEASLFFRLVNYWYELGSFLTTTNKEFKDWPELFVGDNFPATVLLDRLLHYSYVLSIRRHAYRFRYLEQTPNLQR